METIIHANSSKLRSKGAVYTKQRSPFRQMAEFSRYGIIAMQVLVIGGMGDCCQFLIR